MMLTVPSSSPMSPPRSLVERLPGPEAEPGLDHQGDPDAERDEPEEQAWQTRQDRAGQEAFAHPGMVAGKRSRAGPGWCGSDGPSCAR